MREPNTVVHFDYLYMGERAVGAGIDAADGFQYVLVILEDVSGYTWLPPSRAYMANGTVEELVRWCATFGPPTTWVSETRPIPAIALCASWRKHWVLIIGSQWPTARGPTGQSSA